MNIQQTIFTINGLTCRINVNDKSNSTYPKFVQTSSFSNSTSIIDYSVFLNLSLYLKIPDGDKEVTSSESFTVSFFDMYELQFKFKQLLNTLQSDFYEEIEHIDRGLMLHIKPEFAKPIIVTNTTKKNQLGFLPIITYNRKLDTYTPKVKVLINRDDIGVNFTIDRMVSILFALINIDLHVYAINIINTAYSSKAYNKRLVDEGQKSVSIK